MLSLSVAVFTGCRFYLLPFFSVALFTVAVFTVYRWSIVPIRLSSTVMEIWPFEVLPGRLFQEQRSVVGWSSILYTLVPNSTLGT